MYTPRQIYIQPDASRFDIAHRINALSGAQILPTDESARISPSQQKRHLRLSVKKGGHVKVFNEDLGCGEEWYVAPVAGCPFDCEYCYLQEYLGNAVPTIFVNADDMLAELRGKLDTHGDGRLRVHAGHLSDALALDHLTGASAELVELFREFPNATLELRTKTDNVGPLLDACRDNPPENIVVSWTMSPQAMIRRYEHGTASLTKRIRAARLYREAGLAVGMRLDPVVMFPGWRHAYSDMIEKICESLSPAAIESWALGCFRYRPELAEVIRRRFPASDLLDGGFVRCADGKRRYFRPLRLDAYLHIGSAIRRAHPDARIRLCMETTEVRRDFEAAF